MFSAALFTIASTWKQPKCPLTEEWIKKMWCGTCTQWNILFSSVLSHARLFATPWTAARQAFLSITISQRLLNVMSIESVMSSNHLILCGPLLLSSIFPSIRVFSNESVLHIRWPKYWSFSFRISPSNEYSGLNSFRLTCLISLQSKILCRRKWQPTPVFLPEKLHGQKSLAAYSHGVTKNQT